MPIKGAPISEEPAYLIGVEGGGTKTVAAVAVPRSGGGFEILGRGFSGPSNMQAIGFDRTVKNLQKAIQDARAVANLPREPVAAACFVMAGVDREQEELLLTQWVLSHQIAHRIQVANDTVGLLAAGTPEGWGIALIAGTGSITLGKTREGAIARTGGWGYLLGDEGSAYNVALSGMRAAVRAADGRAPENRLLPEFLRRLDVKHADDLLEVIYQSGIDRAGIAAFADVVTAAAADGDGQALGILEAAAEELALLVSTTAKKLKLESAPIPFCFTGGLILNSPETQRLMLDKLIASGIQLADCVPVDEPVFGAFKLAQRLLSSET